MKTIKYLNKVFTIPYLDSLFLSRNTPSTFNEITDCLMEKSNKKRIVTYGEVLKYFYECLKNNHRNETYYEF